MIGYTKANFYMPQVLNFYMPQVLNFYMRQVLLICRLLYDYKITQNLNQNH